MKGEDIGSGFEFADGDEADLELHATRAKLAFISLLRTETVSSEIVNYTPIDFLLQNSLFRLLSGDSRLKFEPGLDRYAS